MRCMSEVLYKELKKRILLREGVHCDLTTGERHCKKRQGHKRIRRRRKGVFRFMKRNFVKHKKDVVY